MRQASCPTQVAGEDDLIAPDDQRIRERPSDEARPAGDDDFHGSLPRHARIVGPGLEVHA
jgi:hypothetical protein